MHVPPIMGIAQVKFKVLDETEPTLSMPMLVADGNRVILRGEVTTLITAKGETAPLMNAGNDWYLKVLINKSTEFIRIDVWTLCHTCPPSWVRNLSPEMKQREGCIVREQTGRKDYEQSKIDAAVPQQFDGYRGDGGIAISIESRRDGRCRAAQGPERPGQTAVVRWKRYDVFPHSSGYERND